MELQEGECTPVDDNYARFVDRDAEKGTHTMEFADGTIHITPRQQKVRKEKDRVEAERALYRNGADKFTLMQSGSPIMDIRPSDLMRLVYLSTYLHYDNYLYFSQKTKMKRADLDSVMGLSKSEVSKFWKSINGRYVILDDEKHMVIPKEYFYRGNLKGMRGSYQSVFIKTVQNLYRRSEPRQHSQLGYIFQLIPYINIKWNILCWNPDEEDIDYVKHMTAFEMCDLIGYDRSNLARLRGVYQKLMFQTGYGEMEHVCAFVYDGVNDGSARIVINPGLIYHGKNYDDVRGYANFF